MTVANAMILVDQTAVPLALPAIMKQFGVSTNVAEWVLNASLLALSGLLILGGKLGDVLGRRRIFLLGTVLFTTGSALGGFAPAFVVLLAARVIQGVGGAMMLPGSVAIVNTPQGITNFVYQTVPGVPGHPTICPGQPSGLRTPVNRPPRRLGRPPSPVPAESGGRLDVESARCRPGTEGEARGAW